MHGSCGLLIAASEDVFDGGGGLIMHDLCNKWVTKGVTFDLHDFIVGPRDIFFSKVNVCE